MCLSPGAGPSAQGHSLLGPIAQRLACHVACIPIRSRPANPLISGPALQRYPSHGWMTAFASKSACCWRGASIARNRASARSTRAQTRRFSISAARYLACPEDPPHPGQNADLDNANVGVLVTQVWCSGFRCRPSSDCAFERLQRQPQLAEIALRSARVWNVVLTTSKAMSYTLSPKAAKS